jgi:Tfp pilus assembly protein PilO
LIGWIVLILVILVVLAVVGLGWDTFFIGVQKGAEKISNLPEVKNLTDKAKSEFDNIVGNSTVDIIAIF